MSKSFAMPGLRIGWLALRDKELFQKLADYKDYTTICSSAPSEILSIMYASRCVGGDVQMVVLTSCCREFSISVFFFTPCDKRSGCLV